MDSAKQKHHPQLFMTAPNITGLELDDKMIVWTVGGTLL